MSLVSQLRVQLSKTPGKDLLSVQGFLLLRLGNSCELVSALKSDCVLCAFLASEQSIVHTFNNSLDEWVDGGILEQFF